MTTQRYLFPIPYSLEPVNMLGYMAKEIKAAN